MLIKRTAIWLLAWGALVWLTGQVLAQAPANSNLDYQTPTPSYENGNAPFSNASPESGSFLPFNPVNFEPSLDMFAPAETSNYGNGPRPHVGYFGSYERLYWSFGKPSFSVIGSETANGPNTRGTVFSIPIFSPNPPPGTFVPSIFFPAMNTADTGFMQANGAWGNRFELGYMDTNNYGWMASVLDHVSQGQYHRVNNAEVEFNDPNGLLTGFIPNPGFPGIIGGNIPIGKMQTQFNQLNMKNITRLNGVELMRMYRPGRLHKGGYMDLLYGVRFLQMEDTFSVNGTNTTTTTTTGAGTGLINPLSDSFWGTRIQNNLIGPEIGARWAHQQAHWVTSIETRFMAAANFQNAHQKTNLGTNTATNVANQVGTTIPLPITFSGIGTDTHLFHTAFAPVGELRLQTTYQVTNNVGFKVGYTGLVMGGISRASNRIDYSGPNLISIKDGGFNQLFFSNGVNVGVEVNR